MPIYALIYNILNFVLSYYSNIHMKYISEHVKAT